MAARLALLAPAAPGNLDRPPLATSDAEIRRRTGRGWEEWFDALDDWGAPERSHREIARWIAERLGVGPLVWEPQAVSISYERARGMRVVGQRADGFAVSVQKILPAPVHQLFSRFVDATARVRWLPGAPLVARGSTPSTAARFGWGEGPGRIHVTFQSKGDDRGVVAVEHARLADADAVDVFRAYWRAALAALATDLEDGARRDPRGRLAAQTPDPGGGPGCLGSLRPSRVAPVRRHRGRERRASSSSRRAGQCRAPVGARPAGKWR